MRQDKPDTCTYQQRDEADAHPFGRGEFDAQDRDGKQGHSRLLDKTLYGVRLGRSLIHLVPQRPSRTGIRLWFGGGSSGATRKGEQDEQAAASKADT